MLQNDSTVRMARGFGNFQESYFILGSDVLARQHTVEAVAGDVAA